MTVINYTLGAQVPLSPQSDFVTMLQEQAAWEQMASAMYSDVMSHFQQMSLHGHKRKARYWARHEMEEYLCLRRFIVDNYGVVPSTGISYNPAAWGYSLKEILTAMLQFYMENKARLDRLMRMAWESNNHIAIPLIECLLKKQQKGIVKLQRLMQRYDDVSYMPHDLHVVDDAMHEKYKKKEYKEGHHIE